MQLDEPLSVSAPLARAAAEKLCRVDDSTNISCAWYHGAWQYFRQLGMVASPARHGGFFHNTLRALAETGNSDRVLVTGAADYSIYAHVLNAYRLAGVDPQVTIFDRCETPLHMCRWYADHVSEQVQTERIDVLEIEPAQMFDVICTHSFIHQFSPVDRPAVIAAWHRALRPGGTVVTNTRLDRSAGDGAPDSSENRKEEFMRRITASAAESPTAIGLSPEDLNGLAKRYINAKEKSRHFSTARQVEELFENGGFELERAKEVTFEAKADNASVDYRSDRPSTYLEIVAKRL